MASAAGPVGGKKDKTETAENAGDDGYCRQRSRRARRREACETDDQGFGGAPSKL
jgi:hypothetical protein